MSLIRNLSPRPFGLSRSGPPALMKMNGQGTILSEQDGASALSARGRKKFHFNGAFEWFSLVYEVIRLRAPSFTASVAAGVMTVTALGRGGIYDDMEITGGGLTPGSVVLGQLTQADGHGPNSLGTYAIWPSQTTTSATVTGVNGAFVDERYQGTSANIRYVAGVEDEYQNAYSGLVAGKVLSWEGSETTHYDYSYATHDKTRAFIKTLPARRGRRSAAPMGAWTACKLPSQQLGIPVRQIGQRATFDRYEGYDSSSSLDFTAGDTPFSDTITPFSNSLASTNQVVLCPFGILTDATHIPTVTFFHSSLAAQTGEALAGPAGYGDAQGDAQGNFGLLGRGIFNTAKEHSVSFAKPSANHSSLAASPASWWGRRQLDDLANSDKTIIGPPQNDQGSLGTNALVTNWASATRFPVRGRAVTTSNRVYTIRTPGTSGGVAPTSTTPGVDITDGNMVLRYKGTNADSGERNALALAGIIEVICDTLRAQRNRPIFIEPMYPFTDDSITLTGITSVGTLCTATPPDITRFTTGQTVDHSGASPAAYNASGPIMIVGGTYTYVAATAPGSSPATGTCVARTKWSTAKGQTLGFAGGNGVKFSALIRLDPTICGANKILESTVLVSGSSTVNGGADDGSRSFKTDPTGLIANYRTGDGIHGNAAFGADGSASITKPALA